MAAAHHELFLNSIVALDMDTGEMAWYYQTIAAEDWEFTSTMQMTLADATIDGEERSRANSCPS